MKKVQRQYRQGDVLITPAAIPANAKQQRSTAIVLAEGEATGHAHRVAKPKGKCSSHIGTDGTLYLRVKSPVEVVHEEHGTVTLEPGDYVIRRQVEVWLDEVRQVMD